MSDKKTKEIESDFESHITEEDINLANELRDKLPDDTFVAIPSKALIHLAFEGNLMHNLQNTLNYLLSTVSEKELFESLIKVKSNFKDTPTDKITPFDEAIWTISMLINEFNYQAAKQKKTAVYDKEEYTSWIAGQLQNDVHPLSGEELQKRMDKDANED